MKARHEFKTDAEYLGYLRTVFAAMAMQGMVMGKYEGNQIEDDVAIAVKIADALLAELSKQKEDE